ncbi:MAG: AbrB/MazE/SpoVT family DNA-binding domain-containing protein [Acidobacteriaceae bacterium]
METTVSTKGQVVLPGPLRRRLGIRPGDSLDATVVADRIVLVPRRKRTRPARIVNDPVSGLPVLTAGPNVPILNSKQVLEALAEFP